MYSKIDHKVVAELKNIVGEINCIQQEDRMEDYSHDEFSLMDIAHMPEAVVLPQTSNEISKILELANRENIPVTPRGGATGLCGGCVPIFGGIVLSLEKMNRILEIDTANQMAVV
ncbi:MAG: FAD-binding oxidoreductase, partial [Candidatus Aminicenantes bacterium]|nr:FAD-binding oxidoreductase [Candidatus Aminicenantes bacterium]